MKRVMSGRPEEAGAPVRSGAQETNGFPTRKRLEEFTSGAVPLHPKEGRATLRQASSSPRIVPVEVAKRSASIPIRCSIETKRFGSG